MSGKKKKRETANGDLSIDGSLLLASDYMHAAGKEAIKSKDSQKIREVAEGWAQLAVAMTNIHNALNDRGQHLEEGSQSELSSEPQGARMPVGFASRRQDTEEGDTDE